MNVGLQMFQLCLDAINYKIVLESQKNMKPL